MRAPGAAGQSRPAGRWAESCALEEVVVNPFLFGSDGTDPEEGSGVLQPQDTLEDLDGIGDVLDTGWSPAERPWAVTDWGTTEREELTGEGLAGRLSRELPEREELDGDGL